LPAIALSIIFGGILGSMKGDIGYPQIVLAQQEMDVSGLPIFDKQTVEDKAHMLEAQANAIDAYFAARGMPMKGTGMKMAEEAYKNGIDWRLLPAIAVRESTGGKHGCKSVPNSDFGYGSCKIPFDSKDHEIEVVARNLGGNNPNTAKHYDGKTTKQILQKYNPPSVIPHYYEQVLAIMNAIGEDPGKAATTVAISNT
jgi:hypothetical protein